MLIEVVDASAVRNPGVCDGVLDDWMTGLLVVRRR